MEGEQELPVIKNELIKLMRIELPRKSVSILLSVILAFVARQAGGDISGRFRP